MQKLRPSCQATGADGRTNKWTDGRVGGFLQRQQPEKPPFAPHLGHLEGGEEREGGWAGGGVSTYIRSILHSPGPSASSSPPFLQHYQIATETLRGNYKLETKTKMKALYFLCFLLTFCSSSSEAFAVPALGPGPPPGKLRAVLYPNYLGLLLSPSTPPPRIEVNPLFFVPLPTVHSPDQARISI